MKSNIRSREITLVAIFTSLTAVGAFISIPLANIPITLQSFFVILSGIILGPKLGALSQILYITIGLIGLPIFSGFSGGLQVVFQPSFGFLIGFIFASYISGLLFNYFKNKSKYALFTSSIMGAITIYLFGLPYMYYILNSVMNSNLSLDYIIITGFLLFLPGDILKTIVIVIIGKKLLYLRNHS